LDENVEATEIVSTEHLMQYVFEMTKAKVKALKEGGGVLPLEVVREEERVVGEEDERDGDVFEEGVGEEGDEDVDVEIV
jgi:intron-binding protein aquarius